MFILIQQYIIITPLVFTRYIYTTFGNAIIKPEKYNLIFNIYKP